MTDRPAASRRASPPSGGGTVATLAELLALGGPRPQRPVPRGPGHPDGGLRAPPATLRPRGLAFAELRPHAAGDDVRLIDWRQSARRGKLYTRTFEAEHAHPLTLFIDLGPSMRFGTRRMFKSVAAAHAAAWLAWRAQHSGDRVAGMIWNGEQVRDVPRGTAHRPPLPLLQALADTSAAPAGRRLGRITAPLAHLPRLHVRGGQLVVISDFQHLDDDGERALFALAGQGRLDLVHVYDPFEASPPAPGCYALDDGQRSAILDLWSPAARHAYAEAFTARRTRLLQRARQHGAALHTLSTTADPAQALSALRPFRG